MKYLITETQINLLCESRVDLLFDKFKDKINAQRDANAEVGNGINYSFFDFIIRNPFMKKTNFKYLPFCLKLLYPDGEYSQVDEVETTAEGTAEYMEFYEKYRDNFSKKDINQYDTEEFFSEIYDVKAEVNSKKDAEGAKSGALKLYEDNYYLVMAPETKEASCYYGQGTKWCIAMKKERYYEDYTDKGVLVFIFNKRLKPESPLYKIALYHDFNVDTTKFWSATDAVLLNTAVHEIIPSDVLEAAYKYVDSKRNTRRPRNILPTWFKGLPIAIMTTEGRLKLVKILKVEGDDADIRFSLKFNDTKFIIFLENSKFLANGDMSTNITIFKPFNGRLINNKPFVIKKDNTVSYFLRNISEDFGLDLSRESEKIKTYWRPQVSTSRTFDFARKKPSPNTDKFLSYIKKKRAKDEYPTKYDFLVNILKVDPNKVTIRGYYQSFFTALKDAGIVEQHKIPPGLSKKLKAKVYYTIGKNYDAFIAGKLERF